MLDYQKLLSKTTQPIPPSGIRKFFDIASEMEDVISLSVGEPNFKTPWAIREAGIQSLQHGRTWYTANAGLSPLRAEICRYMRRRFDLRYDPKTETLVTVGGSEAIDCFLRAVLDPGDQVLVPEPCFVSYAPIARLCGAEPVPIPTRPEDGFRLTPGALRSHLTSRSKALIFPFPNNPTGAVMRREHLEGIAQVLQETQLLVLSDEIYGELTYGEQSHLSLASLPGMQERVVVVNGFSKSYAMTGWRLGYACGPAPILRQMTKVHQFAVMCAPSTSQYAAVEALRSGDSYIEEMKKDYDLRRRLIVSEFLRLGLPCFDPEGAFYIFPDIRSTGLTSEQFCQQLLEQQHVAVVPGTAFGQSGEGFVRVSYCYSIDHILEAVRRIQKFLAARGCATRETGQI